MPQDGDDSRDEFDDEFDDDRDDDSVDCPQCGIDATHGLDHCAMCTASMCRICSVCGGDPSGF